MGTYSVKIAIIVDKNSWLNTFIPHIKKVIAMKINVSFHIFHSHTKVNTPMDAIFLLSYSTIVEKLFLLQYPETLVIHSSNLPQGRGMSPMAWQILEGKNEIPITLLKVSENADSGRILLQDKFYLDGSELINEARKIEIDAAITLMIKYLIKQPNKPIKENDDKLATYYKKRTPADSELNIDMPLCEQFNLLRIVDNEAYPAYFIIDNHKYILQIVKESNA